MAQETGTVTITGTFTSDSGEHTWSITLHGTTHSHSEGLTSYYTVTQGLYSYFTDVQATSFDLQFSGPDADDLNQAASEQFAAGKARLQLRNTSKIGFDLSTMVLWVSSPDESATFRAGNDGLFTSGAFPSDADGYPMVTPETFIFWSEMTAISWYGEFYDEWLDTYPYPNAEISGSLGPEVPPPLPQLSVKLSNNVLTVSWPSPSIGFVLQQNDHLNTSNWVTPTETVTDNGVIRFITVNGPTGSRFFRLFKP